MPDLCVVNGREIVCVRNGSQVGVCSDMLKACTSYSDRSCLLLIADLSPIASSRSLFFEDKRFQHMGT